MLKMGPSTALVVIAVVIFVIAALGKWPTSLADDLQPLPLGLAIFAASFAVRR